MTLSLAPWFSAALDALIALRDIGYKVEDADVEQLIKSATVIELLQYVDN